MDRVKSPCVTAVANPCQRHGVREISLHHLYVKTLQVAPIGTRPRQHAHVMVFAQQTPRHGGTHESRGASDQRPHAINAKVSPTIARMESGHIRLLFPEPGEELEFIMYKRHATGVAFSP